MKKTGSVLKIALAVILALVAAFLVIEAMGFRLFPENAAPKGWEKVINTDEWDFYYFTIPVVIDNVEVGEFIDGGVLAVKKTGILKRLDYYDPEFMVCAPDGEYVGILYRFEGEATGYYFFIRNPMPLGDGFPSDWYNVTSVTVGGSQRDFFKGSYFSAEGEFNSFTMGGHELTLKPYVKQ